MQKLGLVPRLIVAIGLCRAYCLDDFGLVFCIFRAHDPFLYFAKYVRGGQEVLAIHEYLCYGAHGVQVVLCVGKGLGKAFQCLVAVLEEQVDVAGEQVVVNLGVGVLKLFGAFQCVQRLLHVPYACLGVGALQADVQVLGT